MKLKELGGTGVSQTWRQWINVVAPICRRPENAGMAPPTSGGDGPRDETWVELWRRGLKPGQAIERMRRWPEEVGVGVPPLRGSGTSAANPGLTPGATFVPPEAGLGKGGGGSGGEDPEAEGSDEIEHERAVEAWTEGVEASIDAAVARTPGMAAMLAALGKVKAFREATIAAERGEELDGRALAALESMAAEPVAVGNYALAPALLEKIAGAMGVKIAAMPEKNTGQPQSRLTGGARSGGTKAGAAA
jgi:hypothetical protein